MIRLTKIFHFEMAHALHSYNGPCKNIHGHSYELHVTVSKIPDHKGYIPAPGFVIDFKEIKKIVAAIVIESFDHKLILSEEFILQNPSCKLQENLVSWKIEPTAENILLYISQALNEKFPNDITLVHLKLFETKDSYAEWLPGNTFIPR